MGTKEPKKLSKAGLLEAQRKFRARCKKPLPSEVLDLIRETTKDKPLAKDRKEDRAAKNPESEKMNRI